MTRVRQSTTSSAQEENLMMSAESAAPPVDVTLHRAIDHATAALIEIRALSRFAMTQAERNDFARTEQVLRLLVDELVVLRNGAERPLAFQHVSSTQHDGHWHQEERTQ